MLRNIFHPDIQRRSALVAGFVMPDASRCVQCGICSYNCPMEIDVRRFAWEGKPISSSHCLACGECVTRCPRGVLRFERTDLFSGVKK
ncbi:MAG: 4Fe-4S binding protein [Chloroflexota bacterium]